MKRRIYFRADAGKEIGYGHFIRTLALADMLKDDFDCVFVTQAPTDYQKAEVAKVCQLVELPATDEKFRLFLDMLQGNEIVVLDNYFYDTEYQRAVKAKGCKLVCIDDMHDKHYVADLVINHGLSDETLFDVEPYTRLCLGLGWALLRRPFLQDVPFTYERKGVLICLGGSDPCGITNKILSILLDIGVNDIKVVVGDLAFLRNDYRNDTRIHIMYKLSANEMRRTMCSVIGAIVPASSLCIEAMACNLPVMAGYYVDNQKEFYDALNIGNYVMPLGNLTTVKADHIKVALQNLSKIQVPQMNLLSIKENYIHVFEML